MSHNISESQQIPQSYPREQDITTLRGAVADNRPDIVKMLLENGANVNERNSTTGNTPLHLAIIRNSPDIIKMLLENGANVNERNPVGNTPLHLSAIYKGKSRPEISKLLLQKGADMTLTRNDGRTPLDIYPGLAQINREVQSEQNFEVRKPLIQLSKGTDTSSSPQTHYLQNEFVARDIASYIDRNTKGGKYKRKSRKYRKSRKSKRSRKSRKYRR
jgi:ankyrin repeat protein